MRMLNRMFQSTGKGQFQPLCTSTPAPMLPMFFLFTFHAPQLHRFLSTCSVQHLVVQDKSILMVRVATLITVPNTAENMDWFLVSCTTYTWPTCIAANISQLNNYKQGGSLCSPPCCTWLLHIWHLGTHEAAQLVSVEHCATTLTN